MCFKTDNISQLYTGITLLSFSGTNLYYFKSLKYIKTTGPWRGGGFVRILKLVFYSKIVTS